VQVSSGDTRLRTCQGRAQPRHQQPLRGKLHKAAPELRPLHGMGRSVKEEDAGGCKRRISSRARMSCDFKRTPEFGYTGLANNFLAPANKKFGLLPPEPRNNLHHTRMPIKQPFSKLRYQIQSISMHDGTKHSDYHIQSKPFDSVQNRIMSGFHAASWNAEV
jgi:hypothetical protein